MSCVLIVRRLRENLAASRHHRNMSLNHHHHHQQVRERSSEERDVLFISCTGQPQDQREQLEIKMETVMHHNQMLRSELDRLRGAA